jgi:hypothetical protein
MSKALLAVLLASSAGVGQSPRGADYHHLLQSAARVQLAQNTTVVPGTSMPAAPRPGSQRQFIDPTKPDLPTRVKANPVLAKVVEVVPAPVYVKPRLGPRSESTGTTPPLVGIGADSTGQSVTRPDAFIGGVRVGPAVRPDMGIGMARPFASSKGEMAYRHSAAVDPRLSPSPGGYLGERLRGERVLGGYSAEPAPGFGIYGTRLLPAGVNVNGPR